MISRDPSTFVSFTRAASFAATCRDITRFLFYRGSCFAFTAAVNQAAGFFGETFRVLIRMVLHSICSKCRSKILRTILTIVTNFSCILYKNLQSVDT